jgi:hypothetical protein
MSRGLRGWFYLELVSGIVTSILFVASIFNRAWIEVVFRVDPDNGQGWVEWMIVGALLALTIVLGTLARNEWRRTVARVG